jgi:hypothetical protein
VVVDEVNMADNSYRVTEVYDIEFSGSFSFGSVTIPYTNLDSITNVNVLENGQALQAACGNQQAGTFCAETTSNGLSVTYYFFQPLNNSSERFEISYQVNGALRVYEGGDELWWIAIPSDHFGFSIGESTIKVVLPEGYAPREGIDPVQTYGVPSTVHVEGTTITATAKREIVGDETFEIRVQFPHNPAAQAPRWQQSFDQQHSFDAVAMPLIKMGLSNLFLLTGMSGLLMIYSLWL